MDAATMDRPATGEQNDGAEGGAGGDGADVQPAVVEIEVKGTQLTFPDLGGKAPTGATLRISGGKIKLQAGSSFKKGDTITGTFVAVVNDVGQKDTHDAQTGIVVSAEQRHGARFTDLQIDG